MVCVKCSAAADLAEAARSLGLDLTDDVYDVPAIGTGCAGPAWELIDRAVERLHNECPDGTWCACQHRRRTQPTTLITGPGGRTMCTCHGPELPHRPYLCGAVGARIAQRARLEAEWERVDPEGVAALRRSAAKLTAR